MHLKRLSLTAIQAKFYHTGDKFMPINEIQLLKQLKFIQIHRNT